MRREGARVKYCSFICNSRLRPSFTVRDVADLIGHDYPIDIIDVGELVCPAVASVAMVTILRTTHMPAAAQHEIHGWTLHDWAEYFHRRALRRAVLNVISLEFSGTPLEPLVRAPAVVRQIDWIDTVWPGRRHARGQYPRVQLYCLMSVAESWTDFHVGAGLAVGHYDSSSCIASLLFRADRLWRHQCLVPRAYGAQGLFVCAA